MPPQSIADVNAPTAQTTATLILEAMSALATQPKGVDMRPLRIEDLDMCPHKTLGRRKRYDESKGQRYLNSIITSRLL